MCVPCRCNHSKCRSWDQKSGNLFPSCLFSVAVASVVIARASCVTQVVCFVLTAHFSASSPAVRRWSFSFVPYLLLWTSTRGPFISLIVGEPSACSLSVLVWSELFDHIAVCRGTASAAAAAASTDRVFHSESPLASEVTPQDILHHW